MAIDHKIIRASEDFKGIDKRSSDIARTIQYATDVRNAAFRISGAINKRKGFKKIYQNTGNTVKGITTYKKLNTNGSITDETITVEGNDLKRYLNSTINIFSSEDMYSSLLLDETTSTFKFKLEKLDTEEVIYEQDLGTGSDVSDIDLYTLATNVKNISLSSPGLNVVSDFSNAEIVRKLSGVNHVFYTSIPIEDVNIPNIAKSIGDNYQIRFNFSGSHNDESITLLNMYYSSTKNADTWVYEEDGSTWETGSHLVFVCVDDGIGGMYSESVADGVTWTTSPNGFDYILSTDFYSIVSISQLNTYNLLMQTDIDDITTLQSIKAASISNYDSINVLTEQVINLSNFIYSETVTNAASSYSNPFSWENNNGDSVLDNLNTENATFAQLNNCLYISNGYDYPMKYDSESVYRAGLPKFGDFTVSIESDNTVTIEHGYYAFRCVLEYVDKQGNFVRGEPSDPVVVQLNSNNHHFHVNFQTFINSSALDGFNKASTFSDSHPLYNSLPTGNVYGSVNKVQNSKCLRVLIYRSNVGSNEDVALSNNSYLIADLPWNYDATSPAFPPGLPGGEYEDLTLDSDISNYEPLLDQFGLHSPPPKGKYLSVYKNCLVIAGQEDNVNNISYSLPKYFDKNIIGTEAFPEDSNAVVIESSFGDKITAIASLRDSLYIFHKNSIHSLTGSIDQLEVPLSDLVTKEGGIGCQSMASIEEFRNQLIFMSSNGVYSIDPSSGLTEMSQLIKPLFLDKDLIKSRSISFNWVEKNILITVVPKIATDDLGNQSFSEQSLVIVYDYFKEAWLQWDTIEFTNGISYNNNEVLFSKFDENGHHICKFLDQGNKYDYVDHVQPISFNYDTNWESLGEPTVPKKYLRLKIHSFDTDQTFESPEGFDLNVKIQKNYVSTDLGAIDFDFKARSGNGWGNFSWGSGTWGSIATDSLKSKLPTGKSKCMKLRFLNNNINENVLITTYEMEIAGPFKTEIKE